MSPGGTRKREISRTEGGRGLVVQINPAVRRNPEKIERPGRGKMGDERPHREEYRGEKRRARESVKKEQEER